MSLVREATRDNLDTEGAVHNWSCHSLNVVLWRTGPISHQQQHSGEGALCLTQAAQRSWSRQQECVYVSQP